MLSRTVLLAGKRWVWRGARFCSPSRRGIRSGCGIVLGNYPSGGARSPSMFLFADFSSECGCWPEAPWNGVVDRFVSMWPPSALYSVVLWTFKALLILAAALITAPGIEDGKEDTKICRGSCSRALSPSICQAL